MRSGDLVVGGSGASESPETADHPALEAWRTLGGTTARTPEIRELRRKPGRSWVVRLGNLGPRGQGPESVVAKRVPARIAKRELTIYQDVLPMSGVTAPRLLGTVDGASPAEPTGVWLLLEDVGDGKCDVADRNDLSLASEWLVGFARGTASLSQDDVPALSPRDPGHYRRFLEETRSARARTGVGALMEEHGLGLLSEALDRVDRGWPILEEVAAGLPGCVAHGDFLGKNLGVRTSTSGVRCLHPYDWDNAGWGYPGFDMAHLGLPHPGLEVQLTTLERGYRGLGAVWPGLSVRSLERAAALARISWCVSVVAPTLVSFEQSGSPAGVADDLALYGRVLREAVRGLGL